MYDYSDYAGDGMNGYDSPQIEQLATDAAHWHELVTLLNRKAYKTTITPEEIADQLPDLREVYRSLRCSEQATGRTAVNGRLH